MNIEQHFISSVLAEGDIALAHDAKVSPRWFSDKAYAAAWEAIKEHHAEYGVVPDRSLIERDHPDAELTKTTEPLAYYVDHLRKQYQSRILIDGIAAAAEKVEDNPLTAADRMAQALSRVYSESGALKDTDITMTMSDRISRYERNQENAGKLLGLPLGVEKIDWLTGGFRSEQMITIIGPKKAGKAQPLYAPVLTPTGWRKIGDLKPGDQVLGPDGRPSTVTHVWDWGESDVYKVTTDDGAVVEATAEHEWEVRPYDSPPRVVETSELQSMLETGKTRATYLPVITAVEFDAGAEPPLDGYVLGALLGDGSIGSSVRFYKEQQFFLDEFRRRGFNVHRVQGALSFAGNDGLRAYLQRSELLGLRSWEKFIPAEFLVAPVSARLDLLRGLMDTDGGMERKSARFTTSSQRLSDDFVALVRSLGGVVHRTVKENPKFQGGGAGRTAYRHTVRLPEELGCPFLWPEKAERWAGTGTQKRSPTRRVVDVCWTGVEVVRCITVDRPDGLYITSDYVVTHNSTLLLHSAIQCNREYDARVLFLGFEMSNEEQEARHDAMISGINYMHLLRGGMTEEETKKLRRALRRMRSNPPFVLSADPSSTTTLSSVLSKIEQHQPQIVFIDGIYMMSDEEDGDDERKQLTNLSRGVKRLAQRTGIPIVVSTQALDHKIGKSGIRTSSIGYTSAFGQDSDVVIGIETPDYDEPHIKRVRITDARSAPTGECFIDVDWKSSTITEMSGGPEGPEITSLL